MDPSIESVTRSLLSRAIEAAVLRQQVLAGNVANAGLPDTARLMVTFEDSLSRAREDWRTSGRVDPANVADASIDVQHQVDANRAAPRSVQPDEQVAQMALNAAHHQVLLQGLSRHLSLLATAVSEGRR
jgi:flagellar basal-body rod protein FlgB